MNPLHIIKSPSKKGAFIFLFAYILLMVLAAIILSKYIDKEWLQSTVKRFGSFGIIIFIILEFIYVVFTPLYNTAIHIASGYIFGGDLGWVINFISTTTGLFTIIFLVKKYGLPLLKRLIPENFYNKYDKIVEKVGPITLFIVYVVPFTPDDELTYIVSVGSISMKRFILPVLLGNIAKSSLSYIGDRGVNGIAVASAARIITLIIGLIIIGAQEILYKRKINGN